MSSASDVQYATIRTDKKMDRLNELLGKLDMTRIPCHVAIIMDGNGRWARRQSRVRSDGHAEGVNSVHNITKYASDLGIKHLTLYAFSTENWNRPEQEVQTLMYLIGWAIRKETPELVANNVHIRLLGEIDRLPEQVRDDLMAGVNATKDCTGLNLNLCLSYSSRWELTDTMRRIACKVAVGELAPHQIDEQTISSNLSTHDIPDPDLLIRTGGEHRISNFLLWQIAYSELYFTPILWPDFDRCAFVEALVDFQNRERRFGKTSDQVKEEN